MFKICLLNILHLNTTIPSSHKLPGNPTVLSSVPLMYLFFPCLKELSIFSLFFPLLSYKKRSTLIFFAFSSPAHLTFLSSLQPIFSLSISYLQPTFFFLYNIVDNKGLHSQTVLKSWLCKLFNL